MTLVEDDILPPHPIVELPLPIEFYFRSSLLVLLILLIGFLLAWWFWRRYRKKQKTESPYEQALKMLNDVWVHVVEMNDREFAFATSSCVRDYLEVEFNIPAPERTTEEFLSGLSQYEIFRSHDIAYLLKQILEKCDEAKFAKRQFTAIEKQKLYKCAVDLIEQLHYKIQPITSKQRN